MLYHRHMKTELAYISLKHKIILGSFISPALFVVARITGANFLDGLFGVYENTPLQNLLIATAFWAPAIVAIISVWMAIRCARKYNHTEKRFVTHLVPLGVFLPPTLGVVFLILTLAL